jgi:hypothetical protein
LLSFSSQDEVQIEAFQMNPSQALSGSEAHRGHNVKIAFEPVLVDSAPQLAIYGGIGSESDSAEELLDPVVNILRVTSPETLLGTFRQWIERLQACIDSEGEYFES